MNRYYNSFFSFSDYLKRSHSERVLSIFEEMDTEAIRQGERWELLEQNLEDAKEKVEHRLNIAKKMLAAISLVDANSKEEEIANMVKAPASQQVQHRINVATKMLSCCGILAARPRRTLGSVPLVETRQMSHF